MVHLRTQRSTRRSYENKEWPKMTLIDMHNELK